MHPVITKSNRSIISIDIIGSTIRKIGMSLQGPSLITCILLKLLFANFHRIDSERFFQWTITRIPKILPLIVWEDSLKMSLKIEFRHSSIKNYSEVSSVHSSSFSHFLLFSCRGTYIFTIVALVTLVRGSSGSLSSIVSLSR